MKLYQVLFFLQLHALLVTAAAQSVFKKASIIQFGAKSDGNTNCAEAIIKAINSADTIVIPEGNFLINHQLNFSNIHNKTIIAFGATILNADSTKGTLFFNNCSNITLKGGTWTRTKMPETIGATGQEHTFTFGSVKNLRIEQLTINGSPQMGISMMNVTNAIISKNTIKNCFRDGIYAHYSVKLQYLDNRLMNIKDDAMSIHDYGLMNQKNGIIKEGYKQAGYSIIKGNETFNSYQGFSSIGCTNVIITGNKFTNTVNAGIAVFNSEKLSKGGTARVKNITITNNVLTSNGGTQTILGKSYTNQGQLSSGRCALYVAANDSKDFILNPATRLNNITIKNNLVTNSYVNGVYLAQIDNLTFEHNNFTNCNIDKSPYTTKTIEIVKCKNTHIKDIKVLGSKE